MYAKTGNWQMKKELVFKRTYYIYVLFAFMILNIFGLTEDFISNLFYNTDSKNTKFGIKGTQFLRSPSGS
jgi:ABC-type bacteriocin/lantibiotic exporter with double-glycine peptidase domain